MHFIRRVLLHLNISKKVGDLKKVEIFLEKIWFT